MQDPTSGDAAAAEEEEEEEEEEAGEEAAGADEEEAAGEDDEEEDDEDDEDADEGENEDEEDDGSEEEDDAGEDEDEEGAADEEEDGEEEEEEDDEEAAVPKQSAGDGGEQGKTSSLKGKRKKDRGKGKEKGSGKPKASADTATQGMKSDAPPEAQADEAVNGAASQESQAAETPAAADTAASPSTEAPAAAAAPPAAAEAPAAAPAPSPTPAPREAAEQQGEGEASDSKKTAEVLEMATAVATVAGGASVEAAATAAPAAAVEAASAEPAAATEGKPPEPETTAPSAASASTPPPGAATSPSPPPEEGGSSKKKEKKEKKTAKQPAERKTSKANNKAAAPKDDPLKWEVERSDSTEKIVESREGSKRAASPAGSTAGAPGPAKAAAGAGGAPKAPKGLEREGVKEVQTLQLGIAIRSAICIGKEVWTVDWKGQVSIRERDDASIVKTEIPTNRFIWCITHMDPGLMWMGQEAQGISLFDTTKKTFKTVLTGGHSSGVTCIAADTEMGDAEEGALPRRRAWTGSNDFTIRTWWIDTWPAKGPTPEAVQNNPGTTVVELASGFKVGIYKGAVMHGHKNGVKALLRIGPTLWSGSDDGTIRLWNCADGSCNEIVEEAHKGSVLKLSIVRSFVWSAGADGVVKEWNLGGDKRTCTRKVSPPGSEKGVYALVPLGHDVWVCGHHPDIQVYTQHGMTQTGHYKAHDPYVSNVMAVDRVETRVVWSTSIADKTLKVWKHTIRGNQPNIDELRAANRLYEEEEEARAGRMEKLVNRANSLQEELEAQNAEFKKKLEAMSEELAQSQARCGDLEKRCKELEEQWEGLRKIFAEAGLEHLLTDPEALRKLLAVKKLFDEAGLGHLLQDPDLLKKFLRLKEVLEQAGLDCLDPDGVQRFLDQAKTLVDAFKEAGLQHLLDDPEALRAMLNAFKQIKDILEQYGFGDAIKDPSLLAEILSRYAGLKAACEEMGFPELFEDPYNMKGFLRNYGRIREEFRNVNLEYLLDSPPAMRDFLAKNKSGENELKDLREAAQRLADLERKCAEQAAKLDEQAKLIASLQEKLAAYEELGTVDQMRRWKAESAELAELKKSQGDKDAEIASLRKILEDKERERQEALERERLMSMKYKELDIFKLDIIARELKSVDGDFNLLGKQVKIMQTDVGKLRNYDEQQGIGGHGDKILQQCYDIRAHVRDVINKCLSETQKMHIGVAINDPLAEGKLQDGGVMAGYVAEEMEVPDYGSSKAARLRHTDEMRRERSRTRGEGGTARSPSTGTGSRPPG
mmetsp:Transcript_55828/g.133054  ORF Transcript_55828/g.133054 Transcript_55828/m.133054 type:complete len:1273 (-) Transcript_55828:147-3965(-)